MDKNIITLEVTNDKDVAIRGAMVLAEFADDELGVAFYYAPQTRQYVAHVAKTSTYQKIKEVFSGTPDELIDFVVESVGSYHPILKQAVNEAGTNDRGFANAAFRAF